MDKSLLDETTRILTEFARTKFSAQVLEVQGPIQEGSSLSLAHCQQQVQGSDCRGINQEVAVWQA